MARLRLDSMAVATNGIWTSETLVSIAIGGIDQEYCKTAGGESRTIQLNNAGSTAGTVLAGADACTVTFWSNTLAVVTMPAKVAGKYDLTVAHGTNGTSDVLENGVTYYDPAANPIFVVDADATPSEDDAHD